MSYTLRTGVSTAETDHGVALLDERDGEYFTLNPTGALVLRTLLDGGSHGDAITRLTTEYDVDADTAAQDVTQLVGALESAGLLLSTGGGRT
jgi:hypothetical protein